MEVFDISSAFVQIVIGVVLVSVKVPCNRHWRAIRRMNRLLFACYVCIGMSNLITGLIGVGEQDSPVMCLAMLLVSMYQVFVLSDPYHPQNWIAFLLAGAVLQIYTSQMIAWRQKKESRR